MDFLCIFAAMNAESRLVAKADNTNADLGLVFGYAVISTEGGEPYYDLQDEHVPLDVITKAFVDHDGQVACKAMHEGEPKGRIVFSMPVGYDGSDIASSTAKTGLYVGAKFDDDVLAKFESGEYSGFSIGGSGVTEAVD